MTDEAQFHFDGSVNKQNCRVWGEENPHAFMVQDEQTPSLTVWCGVWAKGIIGPFFFEERGHGVSVTAARYCGMLEDFVVPELRRLRIARRKVWWQQDGATAHTARAALAKLEGSSLESSSLKVARSSGLRDHLTIPDFFLWVLKVTSIQYPNPIAAAAETPRSCRNEGGSRTHGARGAGCTTSET